MTHDQSHRSYAYEYEPDTVVMDSDLTMQLQLDTGIWHRRAIGGHTTACGEKIDHRLAQEIRHESYDEKICRDGCFSTFELALSEQANQRQKEEDR